MCVLTFKAGDDAVTVCKPLLLLGTFMSPPPPITHNQLRQSLPFTGHPSSTVGQQMVKIANYNSDRYSKRLPFNHEFGSVTIWRHALTPQSNPRPMVSRGTWGPLEHLDWVPIPFFPFLHPISFLSPFSSASQS